MAEQLGLPEDWLNDAVKGFMPGGDEAPRPVPAIKGIEVDYASPRYLLAMKLMAMRFGEDDEDIEILLRECDIHSAEEALDVLKQLYPTKGAAREDAVLSGGAARELTHGRKPNDEGRPLGDGPRGLGRPVRRASSSPPPWSAGIAGAGFEPATFGL